VKILLLVAVTSRPRYRSLVHALLKLISPGSRISFRYKIANRKIVSFLRWEYLDSDLQSALELAVGDCYRLKQLQRPDFIVDGGSNSGLFLLAASARWTGVPIVAFEPVPANVEIIKAHLIANHFEGSVRVVQAALAGKDGSKRFYLREANQGSFTDELPAEGFMDVETLALAPFLPSDPNLLKLIKLDIEGGEVEVLDALFRDGGIRKTIIVMELHNTPVTRPWIEELAHRIGYRIEFYEVGSVTAHCQLLSPDLLATDTLIPASTLSV
jgi:FkbM family methyltransferase